MIGLPVDGVLGALADVASSVVHSLCQRLLSLLLCHAAGRGLAEPTGWMGVTAWMGGVKAWMAGATASKPAAWFIEICDR